MNDTKFISRPEESRRETSVTVVKPFICYFLGDQPVANLSFSRSWMGVIMENTTVVGVFKTRGLRVWKAIPGNRLGFWGKKWYR